MDITTREQFEVEFSKLNDEDKKEVVFWIGYVKQTRHYGSTYIHSGRYGFVLANIEFKHGSFGRSLQFGGNKS
jgi:hypothetical protein